MSSHLFSLMAQTNTGSDWNWVLIFIVFVIILAVALMIQTRFSTAEADEFADAAHHEDAAHLEDAEAELAPAIAVVAEPKPEPQAAPVPAASVAPDDVKKIEGIGPKVAALLNENGIITYAQLADTSVEKLEEILAGAKLQMMDPASWPQQARLAAAGEWEALQKLQDELQGGR